MREEGSEKWYLRSERKHKREKKFELDLTLGKDTRGKLESDRLGWNQRKPCDIISWSKLDEQRHNTINM